MKKTVRMLSMAIAISPAVQAQDRLPAGYPTKPVRIVIGIAPGGGTLVGMDIVAQAPADGYTLLGASDTLMLNGVLGRAQYDVCKMFAPTW